ncbi:MAG: DegT/DnrJ/EryC1/StrS aminotransferase family protein [Ginsengibacter sp.]
MMAYKIPLFDLNFGDAESTAVLETIQSNWISTGPKNLEFERIFSDMLNVEFSISLTNCTTALHLAFEVLGVKENDEVICPSLSFVATVNAIRYVNAIPIFCDVTNYDDLNLDPVKIRSLISPNTKAIIVMHFAGFPCNMDAIMEIARSYNLKVIEDACHGPLSEYKGKKLGTIGDIGCFSFFSNKNISTGEGGMIVTNKEDIAKEVKLKRSHGMTTMSYQRASGHSSEYDVVSLGYNYRMDDMRASIGVVQLGKLQKDLEQRAKVRSWYLKELERLNEYIFIPFKENKEFVSNYIMPVVIKKSAKSRDKVRDEMHNLGIQTSIHYPCIHRFSIYKYFAQGSSLRLTEYISDNEITLPMYSKLTEHDVKFIVDCLLKAILN